jgi:hypothetical protein
MSRFYIGALSSVVFVVMAPSTAHHNHDSPGSPQSVPMTGYGY